MGNFEVIDLFVKKTTGKIGHMIERLCELKTNVKLIHDLIHGSKLFDLGCQSKWTTERIFFKRTLV